MNSILIFVAAAIAFVVSWQQRRKSASPAIAVIISPRQSTTIARNGAVRSVQSAALTIPRQYLEQLWNPANLENLARTYWRFLSRVTLGLIRVVYGENDRRVVFLARPFTLLRFEAPQYVTEPRHGKVSWRIHDGLLVARAGRGSGFLALDVTREPGEEGEEKLRIEVEVANFYPSIAAGFSTPVYEATQSAIHVLVTHSFLRSLATLRLAESKVGRLASVPPESSSPVPPAESETAGVGAGAGAQP